MEKNKKYYKDLDFIRVLACLSILLYHMNILKGGYLLVCTFFVLSGYLSCVSCFKKEKFSFKDYYFSKLKHLYLPLIIVVFISIAVISLFTSINWFNLKPETTSVLLGYNNFWQLNANLDYFARHVESPFMHLWYMGIIMQFDLIFPFIYLILRKIGDKFNKIIPCIVTILVSIIAIIYFYISSLEQNIMFTYYSTFTRIFSLLVGVSLGVIHSYYGNLVPGLFKEKKKNRILFYLYILILIILSTFIESSFKYFALVMIGVTLLSSRLIDYGTVTINDKESIFNKIIKFLSSISYEVYLVQYPIIFLFQNIELNKYMEIFIIISLTLLISYIIHFSLSNKKFNKGITVLKTFSVIVITIVSLCGAYYYAIAKDHTEEMKELENKLEENEKLMIERQKEYAANLKKEQDEWKQKISDLDNYEAELKDIVANLPIVGVGDSVMLGAIDNLGKRFSNGYFDAQISRTAWVANGILKNLVNSNMLGDAVVLNLGANGDCPEWCKTQIMDTVGSRKVFWLNTTNYRHVNNDLNAFASKYSNLYIIDWYSISNGHPEYFIADGIHLTQIGKQVYTNAIYDAIYEAHLNEFMKQKEDIMNSYEEIMKNKVTFFGNDILLNSFDYVQEKYKDAEFVLDSEFNFENLKQEIIKRKNNETLTNKLVFIFDKNAFMDEKSYKVLIDLCKDYNIYIISVSEELKNINIDKVMIIDFYKELRNHPEYLLADGVHLTAEGNQALKDAIDKALE